MQAREIILATRYILSDMDASRWTDKRLIALLNDGLTDIAKNTILYTEEGYVRLLAGLQTYDVSSEVMKILAVEYKNKPLTLATYAELDRLDTEWRTKTAPAIECYIVDKQKEGCFKVYPILTTSRDTELVVDNSSFGIVTGLSYTDIELDIVGLLGDLGAVDNSEYIKLYFVRKPTLVAHMEDELVVSSLALEPLSHYIAGRALRDNQDVQNRTIGNEELQLYDTQLSDYKNERSKNFSQSTYTTSYNPLGV